MSQDPYASPKADSGRITGRPSTYALRWTANGFGGVLAVSCAAYAVARYAGYFPFGADLFLAPAEALTYFLQYEKPAMRTFYYSVGVPFAVLINFVAGGLLARIVFHVTFRR